MSNLLIHYIMISKIDLSKIVISANGRNVRYDGKVQDKCDLSYLIHQVSILAGNSCWPLWSDIYWYSFTKSELVSYLQEWISKVN